MGEWKVGFAGNNCDHQICFKRSNDPQATICTVLITGKPCTGSPPILAMASPTKQ